MRKYIVPGVWLTDRGLELYMSEHTVAAVREAIPDSRQSTLLYAGLTFVASVTHGDFKNNAKSHKPAYRMQLRNSKFKRRYYSNTGTAHQIFDALLSAGIVTKDGTNYTIAEQYQDYTGVTVLKDSDLVRIAERRLARKLQAERSLFNDAYIYWPDWKTLAPSEFDEYRQRDTLYSVMRDRANNVCYNSSTPYQIGGRTTPVYAQMRASDRQNLVDLRSGSRIASIDLSGAFFACVAANMEKVLRATQSTNQEVRYSVQDFIKLSACDGGIYRAIQRLCKLDTTESHRDYVKAWALEWFNRNHNLPYSVLSKPLAKSRTYGLWENLDRPIRSSNDDAYAFITANVMDYWHGLIAYMRGMNRVNNSSYIVKQSQRKESVWLESVAARLRAIPDCSFSHVYDCVLVDSDHLRVAEDIIAEELVKHGLRCSFKTKITHEYTVSVAEQARRLAGSTSKTRIIASIPHISTNCHQLLSLPRYYSGNTRGEEHPCTGVNSESWWRQAAEQAVWWSVLRSKVPLEQSSLGVTLFGEAIAQGSRHAMINEALSKVVVKDTWLNFSVTTTATEIRDSFYEPMDCLAYFLETDKETLLSRVVETKTASGQYTFSLSVDRRGGFRCRKRARSLFELTSKVIAAVVDAVFHGTHGIREVHDVA